MTVELLYTDGRKETREILTRVAIKTIGLLIGAEMLDTVNLRDGRVMLVDDMGHPKASPVNAAATAMYHAVCRPGTTHEIRGDVAIARDEDFA